MPAATIQIKLPVINGFVEIPNVQPTDTSRLTADVALTLIPDSDIEQIADRYWFIVPPYTPSAGPALDYFGLLNAAAGMLH